MEQKQCLTRRVSPGGFTNWYRIYWLFYIFYLSLWNHLVIPSFVISKFWKGCWWWHLMENIHNNLVSHVISLSYSLFQHVSPSAITIIYTISKQGNLIFIWPPRSIVEFYYKKHMWLKRLLEWKKKRIKCVTQ
jgi:hypothetical protein